MAGSVAPRRANPADYPLTGNVKRDLFTWPEVVDDRNIHGPLSFCIPSAVAGYATLKEQFGTGIPFAQLLEPALALARRRRPSERRELGPEPDAGIALDRLAPHRIVAGKARELVHHLRAVGP